MVAVDTLGLLRQKANNGKPIQKNINETYGFEVVSRNPRYTDDNIKELIRRSEDESSLPKYGYSGSETKLVENYTRLVAARDHQVGYLLKDSDIKIEGQPPNERKYLTNTYNLAVKVISGSKVRWVSYSVRSENSFKAVVKDLVGRDSRYPDVPEFGKIIKKSDTFKSPDWKRDNPPVFTTQTRNIYKVQTEVTKKSRDEFNYNIELWILSAAFIAPEGHEYEGSDICVPIAKIIVDPTIRFVEPIA